jgi:hypothetical protein
MARRTAARSGHPAATNPLPSGQSRQVSARLARTVGRHSDRERIGGGGRSVVALECSTGIGSAVNIIAYLIAALIEITILITLYVVLRDIRNATREGNAQLEIIAHEMRKASRRETRELESSQEAA